MNREIKFRAWNGSEMIDLQKITPLIVDTAAEQDGVFLPFSDKIQLMQYTGLKDKNGKEIYEGDILQYSYSRDTTGKDIVRFDEVVEWEHGKEITGFAVHLEMDFEIIGNIYENPELLTP